MLSICRFYLNKQQNLSTVRVHIIPGETSEEICTWFQTEAQKLNAIYRIRHVEVYTDGPVDLYSKELCIWIAGHEQSKLTE